MAFTGSIRLRPPTRFVDLGPEALADCDAMICRPRDGFTVESSLHFPVADNERLRAVSLHARASRADEDSLGGAVYRRLQFAGGMTLHLTQAFAAEFGYVVQKERLGAPTLSNNVLSVSFTAEF